MALIIRDRVRETTTTTGTGAITLSGTAPDTYVTIGSVVATSDTIYLAFQHQSANEWEVGLYTSSNGTTGLTRTTILASSNAGAEVDWSAGTKDVFGVQPAATIGMLPAANTWTNTQTITAPGTSFPAGWGDNLKIVAADYPAIWFYSSDQNIGVIYAYDSDVDMFHLRPVAGSTQSTDGVTWNFDDNWYGPGNSGSAWDLGRSTDPWGILYAQRGVIDAGSDETAPGDWGNNLQLTADRYPALYFYASDTDTGVIYSYDSDGLIFAIEEVDTGVATGERVFWSFTGFWYGPANSASAWDLGRSTNPWGVLYAKQGAITAAGTTYPNGWGDNLKLVAADYPALWFHSTTQDEGLIYALDTDTDYMRFSMQMVVSGSVNTTRLAWDFYDLWYGVDAANAWDLGRSTHPWGDAYITTLYIGGLQSLRTVRNGSTHTLASATATEVTGLQFATVGVGTFMFRYYLLVQSSATGTGVAIGINHTGTSTITFNRYEVTSGTTAATGIIDDVSNTLTGQLVEGRAANAKTTTAPNTTNTGFVTADSTSLVVVEGVLVVTVSGDLEVWHGSEGAVNTSVMINSCGTLTQVA